ncbi:Spo0E like sporulation regulatory protein [Natronincola peptidivorans]|uniref:Spo0E like sporulation regulatory protein n=1 Tax=Natronincola peptidivorans TaxID=426128 RepID=A0A1H9ZTF7_9FIRM|nr:aspartyl-phosphate phosphatase Spo0E family protein [Natronincola peptidivorans]SES84108.1 Spo0E like sporulation regulatory protein [Natronincola peptidivorans]
MNQLLKLEKKIRKTRKKLHQLIKDKDGNLLDPEVVEASQELDVFMVNYSEMLRN